MIIDVERFTKLMKMTTSNQDGEALNAMRMANSMLKKNKLTWDDVIKAPTIATWTHHSHRPAGSARRSTVDEGFAKAKNEADEFLKRARAERAENTVRAAEIRKMFNYLRKHLEPGETRCHVAEIHADWRKHSKLTPEQIGRLKRIYSNTVRANGHDEGVSA